MGGNTFKDQKTGINPASRIPTSHISGLRECVCDLFSVFFDKIQMVTPPDLFNKKDHGDLDFICLTNEFSMFNVRDKAISLGFFYKRNGNMFHILYPYTKNDLYQVDFICVNDEEEYETAKFFYSNPVVFNAVVGHLARSIGYKFSTKGLLLHVTDSRKQNFYVPLTRDLTQILKILCLKELDNLKVLFESPDVFFNWISSSSRFDSDFFKKSYNRKSHRDAKTDSFCFEVYEKIESSKIKAIKPPTIVDFSIKDFDLAKSLSFEREILGDGIIKEVLSVCDEKNKKSIVILSGDDIINLGYPSGPKIGEILTYVNNNFSLDDNKEKIISNIKERFVL